jgi:hypothetical protein
MVSMFLRRFLSNCSSSLLLTALLSGIAPAQQVVKDDLAPAKLSPVPYVLLDAVVTQQWPATLPLVNAPVSLSHLSPGQCIRVGVVASGKGHAELVGKVSLGFTVWYRGKEQTFPTQAPQATKQMKPEGSDFVTSALAAAAIKAPDMNTASMAGSAGKWCVPADAQGGKVEVEVAASIDGKAAQTKQAVAEIDPLLNLPLPFKNADEANEWVQRYHFAPRPALLVPAMQTLAPYKSGQPFAQEFLSAALKQDRVTAARLGPALAASDRVTRLFTLDLLAKAGIPLDKPPMLSEEDKQRLAQAPALTDPFDMAPNRELFSKLDRLWGNFAATGRIEPVKALTSALAWREDYDAFVQMQKDGRKATELTDSLVRAVTYMAAGWSLDSFKHSDGLAADYIEAIAASPDTPATIQKQLAGLDSEPAFKHNSEK